MGEFPLSYLSHFVPSYNFTNVGQLSILESKGAKSPKIPPVLFVDSKEKNVFFVDYLSRDSFVFLPVYSSKKGRIIDAKVDSNGNIYVAESNPDQLLHFH